MTAEAVSGRHALHLHADAFHFSITVGQFLSQAAQANAQLRWHLPRRLERALRRVLRGGAGRVPAGAALDLPSPPDPGVVKTAVLHALQEAIAAGHSGLWLVLSWEEAVENDPRWREAEAVLTELCAVHPLVVMCCYPAFGHATRALAGAAPARHSHYYLGGEFRPMGSVFPEVRSRSPAPDARAPA